VSDYVQVPADLSPGETDIYWTGNCIGPRDNLDSASHGLPVGTLLWFNSAASVVSLRLYLLSGNCSFAHQITHARTHEYLKSPDQLSDPPSLLNDGH